MLCNLEDKGIMKRLMTYIVALAALFVTAACSSDEEGNGGSGKRLEVRLNLASRNVGLGTRAAFDDENAADGEFMKNWFVLAVQDGKVAGVVESKYTSGEKSEDSELLKIPTGSVTFYAFANITKSELATAAGCAVTAFTEGGTLPTNFESATMAVNGEAFTVSDAKGIPMSSKTVVSVDESTKSIHLLVVRMYAKMTLKFTNSFPDAVTVKSFSLSDMTSDGQKIGLFPTGDLFTGTGDESKTIGMNLADNVATADITMTPSLTVSGNQGTGEVTFYVNESRAKSNLGYFMLTLNVDDKDASYALLNWSDIVRNDYCVVPVVIDDYKLEVNVTSSAPIGVYPPSVMEEDGLFTCTFHHGGSFNIVPRLKSVSTGAYIASEDMSIQITRLSPASQPAILPTEPLTYAATTGRIPGYMSFDETGEATYELKVTATIKGSTRVMTYRLKLIKE